MYFVAVQLFVWGKVNLTYEGVQATCVVKGLTYENRKKGGEGLPRSVQVVIGRREAKKKNRNKKKKKIMYENAAAGTLAKTAKLLIVPGACAHFTFPKIELAT